MHQFYIEHYTQDYKIEKGSTVGKIESTQECNLTDLKALQKQEGETTDNVSSIGEERINAPSVNKSTVTEMIE